MLQLADFSVDQAHTHEAETRESHVGELNRSNLTLLNVVTRQYWHIYYMKTIVV